MGTTRAHRLAWLDDQLTAILADAERLEETYQAQLDQLHPGQLRSGLNLLHYLALRRRDVRGLQEALADQGLSSLGRLEGNVMAGLRSIQQAVRALQGRNEPRGPGPVTVRQGRALLKRNTRALFGRKHKGSAARIMVTLPLEAVDDPELILEYLEAGMNCARINCAQGTPDDWKMLVGHVRRAQKATGRACRIFMDLAGPKIRTGPLVPGAQVMALRPKRDARGNVAQAAPVILVPWREGDPPPGQWRRPLRPAPPSPPVVPVSADLFAQMHPGDRLSFLDARGVPGSLEITGVTEDEARALCHGTVYLETGLRVSLDTGTEKAPPVGAVGLLPPLDNPIVLHVGDTLVIHKDPRPGEPAVPAYNGFAGRPAHVSCTLPQVLDDVRVGEPVVLDDGKAKGIIRVTRPGEIEVEITHARPDGTKLRSFKGINVPESRLRLAGVTAQDKEDLKFIAAHADGVNVSFVNHPDDVEDLLDELEAVGGEHLALTLKIETQWGFQRLPGILLAALEWPKVGVMIARGDLAVEAGFVHLAAMQEEILWVCEAAHVPVVWATEVLDRMAKKGTPTRSEISDVVMAERAECVMLNKGPYIIDAIRTLDQVLRSVQAYQRKKSALLPALTLDAPDPQEVGRAVGLRQGRFTD